jgi:hypothetical protein
MHPVHRVHPFILFDVADCAPATFDDMVASVGMHAGDERAPVHEAGLGRETIRHAIHVLTACVCVAIASPALPAQTPFALGGLTVPPDRLAPTGCALSPAPTARLSGKQVRGGFWAGLPISSNPWIGTDPKAVVAIRERVVSSPPPPDGPPLSVAQLTRFRLQLADDIEEAYAAVYADASPALVTVHAVRFKETAVPPRTATRDAGPHYFDLGRTVVVVSGEVTDCFNVVRTHVAAVTGR